MAKFNISNSEMCTFCLQLPDATNHLLLDCRIAEKVWERYRSLDFSKINVNIASSNVNQLLGFLRKKYWFLVFKQFIVIRPGFNLIFYFLIHY